MNYDKNANLKSRLDKTFTPNSRASQQRGKAGKSSKQEGEEGSSKPSIVLLQHAHVIKLFTIFCVHRLGYRATSVQSLPGLVIACKIATTTKIAPGNRKKRAHNERKFAMKKGENNRI